jgi:hypothetical protein
MRPPSCLADRRGHGPFVPEPPRTGVFSPCSQRFAACPVSDIDPGRTREAQVDRPPRRTSKRAGEAEPSTDTASPGRVLKSAERTASIACRGRDRSRCRGGQGSRGCPDARVRRSNVEGGPPVVGPVFIVVPGMACRLYSAGCGGRVQARRGLRHLQYRGGAALAGRHDPASTLRRFGAAAVGSVPRPQRHPAGWPRRRACRAGLARGIRAEPEALHRRRDGHVDEVRRGPAESGRTAASRRISRRRVRWPLPLGGCVVVYDFGAAPLTPPWCSGQPTGSKCSPSGD